MIFKHEKDLDRFHQLHPQLQEIVINMAHWCDDRGIRLCITATWTTFQEDKADGRKEATHREKRAVDISIFGWSNKDIQEFMEAFIMLYGTLGAVGRESGVPTLFKYGDDAHLDHIHCQLNRKYAVA